MKTRKNPHNYEAVLKHFGGTQQGVATALKCNRAAVANWKKAGFPWLRTFQIEVVSGGKFKAAMLPTNGPQQ